MGNYADVQWADHDANRHYLVSWGTAEAGDEHHPMGFASLSEIVDKYHANAFAEATGEYGDVVTVWRLCDAGPAKVDVTFFGAVMGDVAMVEVVFSWQDPADSSSAGAHRESGYYRTPEV